MTAGTLQYMDMHVVDSLTELPVKPLHVLIHYFPVHKKHNFWKFLSAVILLLKVTSVFSFENSKLNWIFSDE